VNSGWVRTLDTPANVGWTDSSEIGFVYARFALARIYPFSVLPLRLCVRFSSSFFALFVPSPHRYAKRCGRGLFAAICFPVNPQNHKALAYGTFRLALGIVELMHCLARLPILAGFAANMVKQFQGTILPGWFVYGFGSVLPFLEGLIGLALILGLFTRWALLAASLLMSILIFGTSLHSDWAIVGTQMIYVIAFFIALFFLEHNQYSVDRLIRRDDA
jgi:thiosulfate dehydrogenase (quinone) large subunit